MGDRVLYQVVGSDGDVSPVAYAHWDGSTAAHVCARLKARMATRPNDVQYTFARLIQELCAGDTGNTGYGAWNAPSHRQLTKADSHGDAGCVLIHLDACRGMRFECLGGYLETEAFAASVEALSP